MKKQNKELESRIEIIRNMLVEFGLDNGLGHPETIKLSQELDDLIAEYLRNSDSNYQQVDILLK